MTCQAFPTGDATRNLEDLYDYIESHDAPENALYFLDQKEKVFSSLAENPHRGVWSKELLAVGLRDFREVFFKPYRIIYRVMAEKVYVMVIADGRRDMQTLLQRRLLRA